MLTSSRLWKQPQRIEACSTRRAPRRRRSAADLRQRRAHLVAREHQDVRIAEDRLDQARVRGQKPERYSEAAKRLGEAVDQLRAVEQQAVVEAARADAADEAVEVVHRPLAVRPRLDRAREVLRELLDLRPTPGWRQQLRDVALEQVEQRADAVLGEQRRERGADLGAMALELVARTPRRDRRRRTPWRAPARVSAACVASAGDASAARPPSAGGSRRGAGTRRRGGGHRRIGLAAARRPAPAPSAPAASSGRAPRGMRPPCRSCRAWATNSTSRMPPAPTLRLKAPPARSASPARSCSFIVADGGDAGEVHRRAIDHRIDGADRRASRTRDRRRPGAPS